MMRTLLAVCMLGLTGCSLLGDETQPIPTEFVPARAPSDNHTLFIVLPGIFDDDDDLKRRRVHDLVQRVRSVWVVCGTEDDRMLPGARLLGAELPASHYLERPGAHDWDFWYATAEEILALAQAQSRRVRAGKGAPPQAQAVRGARLGQ